MFQLTNEDLNRLNKLGLIPGPDESEEEFVKRVEYCQKYLKGDVAKLVPFSIEVSENEDIMHNALHKTAELFDIYPSWVPLFFSNYQLSPWHGGCAWITDASDDTPPYAFLQLRSVFKKSAKFLGIYSRDELIAHELVHVGRMRFFEPKFEEIFAFLTSSASFRRIFGPVIESARESYILMGTLFLVLVLQLFFASILMLLIPLALAAFGLGRLMFRHSQFLKCHRQLTDIYDSSQIALAVMYRLTDTEICDFGSLSEEEIRAYAKQQNSLRWRMIKAAYETNNMM